MEDDKYAVSVGPTTERDPSPTDERRGFTFRIPCDDCGSDGVNLLTGPLILCQSCVGERFKRARQTIKNRWEH